MLSYQRGSLTPTLEAMPEIFPDLAVFWEAFCELSAHRQIGFGACPISVAEVKAYADLLGWSSWMGSQLLKYVRALDKTYLEWLNKDKSGGTKPDGTPKREQIGSG